jgi:hypothetical protein
MERSSRSTQQDSGRSPRKKTPPQKSVGPFIDCKLATERSLILKKAQSVNAMHSSAFTIY